VGVARALAVLLCLTALARADTHTLRIATVVPDGTAWAREMRAFQRELDSATDHHVLTKLFFSGIAGDEGEVMERISREQLDGTASGGMMCQRVIPSMRALMVPGLFQTREEAAHVMHQLQPVLAKEAREHGYELLGTTGLGPVILFSRTPVRTLAELRRLRVWVWDLDQFADGMRALGLTMVPTPLYSALRAYEEGRLDGFLSIPTGALAFHWSARAGYLTDLRMRYLSGCLLVASRAFDRLPYPEQQSLRAAAAHLDRRLELVTSDWDTQLLGGLFQKQGVTPVPPSESFRSEFFAEAHKAREQLDPKVVPAELIARVTSLLADFRAERAAR
jgi:TRAP-type C4-dicarboxylate transport system substrate-binding protein